MRTRRYLLAKVMGCGSSSVKPSSVVPQVQINGNKTDYNNQIRGDRVSMVDARRKRDDDSKARLRKLSEQFPFEIDKVAQTKSDSRANSSTPSSGNFGNQNASNNLTELKYKTNELSSTDNGDHQMREALSEITLKNQADAIVKDVLTKAKIKYSEEQSYKRNNPLINISPATTIEASNSVDSMDRCTKPKQ